MGVRNRLNVLFEYTAYSRFLVVILGLLQNTIATAIAEDYLEGAIDGDEYLKKIINGESKYSIIKKNILIFPLDSEIKHAFQNRILRCKY